VAGALDGQAGGLLRANDLPDNARTDLDWRRSIPLTNRVAALLDIRKATSTSQWVFPAPTGSGHIEQSSLKKQHTQACRIAGIKHLPPYTFRHTCLPLWSTYMDPYTLAYVAQSGHNPGHSATQSSGSDASQQP